MSTTDRRGSLALGNLVANWLALIVIAVSDVAPLRALACLVLVFGTGVALVPLLRLRDPALELTLILLVSIVVLICVAQAVTYIDFFSWRPCEITLFVVTLLGTTTQVAVALVSRRGAPR